MPWFVVCAVRDACCRVPGNVVFGFSVVFGNVVSSIAVLSGSFVFSWSSVQVYSFMSPVFFQHGPMKSNLFILFLWN